VKSSDILRRRADRTLASLGDQGSRVCTAVCNRPTPGICGLGVQSLTYLAENGRPDGATGCFLGVPALKGNGKDSDQQA
jgi:hypothetical protein